MALACEACLVHAIVSAIYSRHLPKLFAASIGSTRTTNTRTGTCPTACVHNCWQASLPCLAFKLYFVSLSLSGNVCGYVCICVCVRAVWEYSILT